ncbi:MAG: hypothetical protein ACM3Q2_10955, partial [Syntrophothermus sp.]
KLIDESIKPLSEQAIKLLDTYKTNLLTGISYYSKMIPDIAEETENARNMMHAELMKLNEKLLSYLHPHLSL